MSSETETQPDSSDDPRLDSAGGRGGSWLPVAPGLAIPLDELRLKFVRSGGPGGQHVNTSSTQVELTFDVGASPSLDEDQRQRILQKLAHLIDGRGVLHLTSQGSRSQHRNREDVVERLTALLKAALHVQRPRRPTRPTARAKAKRLETKRQHGAIKRDRQQRWDGSGP